MIQARIFPTEQITQSSQKGGRVNYEDPKLTWRGVVCVVQKATSRRYRVTGAWNQISKTRPRIHVID